MNETTAEQEIIALSAKKWQWMSKCDMPALTARFHPKAVFVHMGGAGGTERESKVTLLAVVGGHEGSNLVEVTEANPTEGDGWSMVALVVRSDQACVTRTSPGLRRARRALAASR